MKTRKSGRDFLDALSHAIDGLWAVGFQEDAKNLREIAFETAWTSSSEMVGEIGLAILRVERRGRGRLPKDVARGLAECMKYVKQVWPGITLGRSKRA